LDCFSGDYGGGDTIIVIGSEADGIDPSVLDACDGAVSIPMPGGAESLNAGVAAAILMYETVRRDRLR
jgi:23S rRNA (guanosine2251-2'-O)-methyltransferase